MTIGIDPSLNSTGICINDNGECKYYIITSKLTKKMKDFKNDYVEYMPYDKLDTNKKNNDYNSVEYNKSFNIYRICSRIKEILEQYNGKVFMEGVSYGSVGSSALVDLAGLNFAIRQTIIDSGHLFTIVSPTQNKKFATGNGAADKNLMIDAWKRLDSHIRDITEVKIDDLADAYFLSCYQEV